MESIAFPETVISMAIEPETSMERKKLADVLEMMKRQDPTFRARENEETGQTLISGMGELHLEVIKHRLLRDFRLNVRVHKPRVSYRETIERAGRSHRRVPPQRGRADALGQGPHPHGAVGARTAKNGDWLRAASGRRRQTSVERGASPLFFAWLEAGHRDRCSRRRTARGVPRRRPSRCSPSRAKAAARWASR